MVAVLMSDGWLIITTVFIIVVIVVTIIGVINRGVIEVSELELSSSSSPLPRSSSDRSSHYHYHFGIVKVIDCDIPIVVTKLLQGHGGIGVGSLVGWLTREVVGAHTLVPSHDPHPP
jgi:hypothetical protein